MISKLSFFLAVLVAGGLMGHVSDAADVTVRAINGKTGQPLVGYLIRLGGNDTTLPSNAEPGYPLAKGVTGPDGTATFHLDEPLPKALFIEVEETHYPRRGMIGCTWNLLFSTDEVLRLGIVGDDHCDPSYCSCTSCRYPLGPPTVDDKRCDPGNKTRGRFSAKPGEVVVFARKKTFRDSL